MRRTIRGLVVATALTAPLLAVSPAFAYTVQVPGTDQCADATTPTVQYNNGDPTMQPGHAAVYNCAK